MSVRSSLLVTASELNELLLGEAQRGESQSGGADLAPGAPRTRVLHLNWTPVAPTTPTGADNAAPVPEGHIPGAVTVDAETELAEHGPVTLGRHPLPGAEALTQSAHRWGLNPGDSVVAYDTGGNMGAARLWWVLKDAGVSNVRLLDGGLQAWAAAGLPLETAEVVPTPGTIELTPGHMPRVEFEEVGAFAREHLLLDARSGARYRGETEPIDPVAGHIPSAKSLPTTENIDDAGFFLPTPELREQFEAVGVTDGATVGVYCGSGVTASHEIFALALTGVSAALYPGSWSQWSNHAELPVATGSTP